jgi:hypothetical protein
VTQDFVAELVTFTVWMLKLPEEEAWQPAGGLCAKAVAAKARTAKDFIFRSWAGDKVTDVKVLDSEGCKTKDRLMNEVSVF